MASSIIITAVGWLLTDKVIEPKLKNNPVDGDTEDLPQMEPLEEKEKKALKVCMYSSTCRCRYSNLVYYVS